MLGPEYNGQGVDRLYVLDASKLCLNFMLDTNVCSEIPGLKAVHFFLHDHLDRSYNASSTYDGLGKNCCEYLRAKYVDIPNKFLRRGRI